MYVIKKYIKENNPNPMQPRTKNRILQNLVKISLAKLISKAKHI